MSSDKSQVWFESIQEEQSTQWGGRNQRITEKCRRLKMIAKKKKSSVRSNNETTSLKNQTAIWKHSQENLSKNRWKIPKKI